MSDAQTIDDIDQFLAKCTRTLQHISGICVLTVADGTLTGTFIFNYTNKQMMTQYPVRQLSCNSPVFETINGTRWSIRLATRLPDTVGVGKMIQTQYTPQLLEKIGMGKIPSQP